MLWIITSIVISYLIGSIPTAYIFGRLLKGIDIRSFGSGNVGATNALRVLGKTAGISVLAIDILKGFIAVTLLGGIDPGLRIIAGISCICGHNWTVFLNFRGGKGIATTFGVLLGLAMKTAGLKPIIGLIILTWFLLFFITGVVSIASIAAAISLPIYMIIFKQPNLLKILSILLSVFVIFRHKSNLKRIFKGQESRLKFQKTIN